MRILLDQELMEERAPRTSLIRTFLEYIVGFCCFESFGVEKLKSRRGSKSQMFFVGFVVSPSISYFFKRTLVRGALAFLYVGNF